MKKQALLSLALFASASMAVADPPDIGALIRDVQERSNLVQAAQSHVLARRARLASARSGISPQLELAPGVGLTNGNSLLSQEFDLSGKRTASARIALIELQAAEIEVVAAKAAVTIELLSGLAKLLAAVDEAESARSTLSGVRSLHEAVAKLSSIGEAPKVHVTRVEIEVIRAEQQLALANGKLEACRAALQSLLGKTIELPVQAWPATGRSGVNVAVSLDVLKARLNLEQAEARARMTRADFGPTFSAGIASDIWSFDRDPFRSDNFGFQVTLKMPLFDRGQRKGAEKASELEVAAARASLDEAQRRAALAITQAVSAYTTAESVARSYSSDVVPKGESMVASMREGYASGLVTLVELLEAQQTLTRLRQERVQALLSLRLAEVDLWHAQLNLPGIEVPR